MLRFIWGRRGSATDIEHEEREIAIEFIEKYSGRLASSSFMDDKRASMKSLKTYAEKYPLV